LPEPPWLESLLISHDPVDQSWFFIGIVSLAAVVCGLVFRASRLKIDTAGLRLLFGVAVVLAVLCVLLVPVNFGAVLMPYSMGRTTHVGKATVEPGRSAWMLWEGKEWITYYVKSGVSNSVVAVPVKEIDRIEVSGSDSLFDILSSRASGCR